MPPKTWLHLFWALGASFYYCVNAGRFSVIISVIMFSKRSSGSSEEPARRRRITDDTTPAPVQNSGFKRNQTLRS